VVGSRRVVASCLLRVNADQTPLDGSVHDPNLGAR
jgi:hypothetical protein